MKTKAIAFTDINKVELLDVEIPSPGCGEVVIKTHYSCLSPGTELRCLSGNQPNAPFPFIPGYAISGEVIETGPETTLPVGAKVLCAGTRKVSINRTWGGHIAEALAPETLLHRLPDDVNMLNAVAVHLAAVSYKGMFLDEARPSDTVAVIGLGPIGHLSALLHASTGARVIGIDLSEKRVEIMKKSGVYAFVPEKSVSESFIERFPEGANIVVDCTGVSNVLNDAMMILPEKPWDDLLTIPQKFVVQGSYSDKIPLSYRAAYSREAQMIFPSRVLPMDIRATIDLFTRGKIKPETVLSETVPISAAPEAYATLRDTKDKWLTVAFDWSSI